MTFEQDYNKLLSYAKACLKNNYSLTEYDLVNDAFLHFHDKPYNFAAAKTYIGQLSSNDVSNTLTVLENIGHKSNIKEHDKFCKACNESKPVAAFYYNYNNDRHAWRYSTYCKKCTIEKRDSKRIKKERKVKEEVKRRCKCCNKEKNKAEYNKFARICAVCEELKIKSIEQKKAIKQAKIEQKNKEALLKKNAAIELKRQREFIKKEKQREKNRNKKQKRYQKRLETYNNKYKRLCAIIEEFITNETCEIHSVGGKSEQARYNYVYICAAKYSIPFQIIMQTLTSLKYSKTVYQIFKRAFARRKENKFIYECARVYLLKHEEFNRILKTIKKPIRPEKRREMWNKYMKQRRVFNPDKPRPKPASLGIDALLSVHRSIIG